VSGRQGTPSLGVGTGVSVWGGAGRLVGNDVTVADGLPVGVSMTIVVGMAFVMSATVLTLGVSWVGSKVALGVAAVADGSQVGLGVTAAVVRLSVGLRVAAVVVRIAVEVGVITAAVRSGVGVGVSVVADGTQGRYLWPRPTRDALVFVILQT
jgi:hypothetical protein